MWHCHGLVPALLRADLRTNCVAACCIRPKVLGWAVDAGLLFASAAKENSMPAIIIKFFNEQHEMCGRLKSSLSLQCSATLCRLASLCLTSTLCLTSSNSCSSIAHHELDSSSSTQVASACSLDSRRHWRGRQRRSARLSPRTACCRQLKIIRCHGEIGMGVCACRCKSLCRQQPVS